MSASNLGPDSEQMPTLDLAKVDLSMRMEAGIILLDKQPGPTSHQLTAWIRELLGLARLAHGGTLDPFASGVLPLLVGKAMKLTPLVLTHDKTYIALLRTAEPVPTETVLTQLKSFRGRIYNVPPEISAVKVQVRTRRIDTIELLDSEGCNILISMKCEAGTYVRTIARDLGLLLDQSCELTELRRTKSGQFRENQCVNMTQLADAIWKWRELGDEQALQSLITPIESMLQSMPHLLVKQSVVQSIGNGSILNRPGVKNFDAPFSSGDRVVIVDEKGRAIAIAESLVDSDALSESERGPVAQPRQQLRS